VPRRKNLRPEIVARLCQRIRTAWLRNLLSFADLPDDAAPTIEEVIEAVRETWSEALRYKPPKPRPKKPRPVPRWLVEARRRLREIEAGKD